MEDHHSGEGGCYIGSGGRVPQWAQAELEDGEVRVRMKRAALLSAILVLLLLVLATFLPFLLP